MDGRFLHDDREQAGLHVDTRMAVQPVDAEATEKRIAINSPGNI